MSLEKRKTGFPGRREGKSKRQTRRREDREGPRWIGNGKRNPSLSEGTDTRKSSKRDMGMEREDGRPWKDGEIQSEQWRKVYERTRNGMEEGKDIMQGKKCTVCEVK